MSTHEELSALRPLTHLLCYALLCYADDEGYFNANPGLIKGAVFPLRKDATLKEISSMLSELIGVDFIRIGKGADGRSYGRVTNFDKHQRVSHPSPSKIKNLEITWECSGEPPEILRSNSGEPPETFGPEQGTGNREVGTGNREGGTGKPGTGPKAPPFAPLETEARDLLKSAGIIESPALLGFVSQAIEYETRRLGHASAAKESILSAIEQEKLLEEKQSWEFWFKDDLYQRRGHRTPEERKSPTQKKADSLMRRSSASASAKPHIEQADQTFWEWIDLQKEDPKNQGKTEQLILDEYAARTGAKPRQARPSQVQTQLKVVTGGAR